MIIYLYKECHCKYKGLNFILDTDGKLLELIVKVMERRIKETKANREPMQVFILTKDYHLDSQDDKIFPKHFEIDPKIEYPI